MLKSIIFLLATLMSHQVLAAELAEGQWEGKVAMHGKEPAKAIYRVRTKQAGDSIKYKIEMFYIERPYKFKDLAVDESEMTFLIDTGEDYVCTLTSDGVQPAARAKFEAIKSASQKYHQTNGAPSRQDMAGS